MKKVDFDWGLSLLWQRGMLALLLITLEAKLIQELLFCVWAELRAQLALEELRKKRLVEAFKKTSHEFRETCYQLLGYKIDMPATGQYRLASMYAESPHDYLLFKVGTHLLKGYWNIYFFLDLAL